MLNIKYLNSYFYYFPQRIKLLINFSIKFIFELFIKFKFNININTNKNINTILILFFIALDEIS